jgi:phosphohistidine phosphatase
MLKNLFIIRHAKSSWDYPLLSDHERPLNERGLKDAHKMSAFLLSKNIIPNLIISSDATRAKHTALIFSQTFKLSSDDLLFSRNLYHASADHILKMIKSIPDSHETVFVFAHNPGINELAWKYGFQGENIPTTGVLGLQFESEKWSNIASVTPQITFYNFPKNLT